MDIISNTGSVYILSIDAKDIYRSNHYINPSPTGYKIRDTNGDINVSRFTNVLDYSLDLIKLREVYEKVYRRTNFSFFSGKKEYTQRVINVTFKYSIKEYNKLSNNLYVKFGYSLEDIKIDDCLYIKDNELIAVQTNEPVKEVVSNDVLGKYFFYEDGVYKAKTNIKTIKNVSELREDLYNNGFICDGIKYIRFKRSAGSSRVGKCLFIDEKLYSRMHRWEMCGLKVREGQGIDLAALEAYIALPLSSIIGTIEIFPENILVVDDFESTFEDTAIAVDAVNNKLVASERTTTITNSCWDGQSLIDISLMGEYAQHGFVLCRNRMFKSACFNCNLQQWFADNGITQVDQLNGFTLAKRIEDVKLVTTPSSIKFLKFGTLQQWLEQLEPLFGVVKYEKPTHFFDGELVQTHYQLLNTLQLSQDEVDELLAPSLKYLNLIKTDPDVLRYHIKYPEEETDVIDPVKSKNDIVYKMLGINNKFAQTKLYYEFKNDLTKAYTANLRQGRVLVHGNYATMLGNPIEMLQSAIGRFDGTQVIQSGTIYSKNFKDGKTILGSRSPHCTMGNILIAKNQHVSAIDTYFNLTKEIVCINSIRENTLERLSGADQDSRSALHGNVYVKRLVNSQM